MIRRAATVRENGGAPLNVETFEIDSKARLIETDGPIRQLDTKKVLVLIDHDNKVIYLWRGKKADVVTKLVGTRVAARLSHTYPDYRIRPVGEGSEPAALKELFRSGDS